ncbi:MAG: DNA replication and repair protein RecF [Bacteroidales bacterium]|jgi:DNA replication and repair protein RecF|nr:DNA replication and repair protein RecF [Bacteroidales bacterium]
MIIKNLHCYQYRNIEDIAFECNSNINCIVGQNGVGKTNILDSIYYLAYCKSNIVANDALHVKHGCDAFMIQGLFENNDQQYKIHCAYKNKEKVMSCNEKKYSRLSEHIGLIPLIYISPADAMLIHDGASERRKFIDAFISIFDKQYLQHLLTYNTLLAQRNSLLKTKRVDSTYLSVIDEQMSNAATAIFETRQRVIADFSEQVCAWYARINTSDECGVVYETQLNDMSMSDLLQQNFEKDCMLTHTSAGIHRDDLLFYFNGGLLKTNASQGQKKSFLLALKFAQYFAIKEKKQMFPILLLDDLFDKLDKERTQKIIDLIGGKDFGQIFITDTNKLLLHSFFETHKEHSSLWVLESGKLKIENN